MPLSTTHDDFSDSQNCRLGFSTFLPNTMIKKHIQDKRMFVLQFFQFSCVLIFVTSFFDSLFRDVFMLCLLSFCFVMFHFVKCSSFIPASSFLSGDDVTFEDVKERLSSRV